MTKWPAYVIMHGAPQFITSESIFLWTMPELPSKNVTQMLADWRDGDRSALNELLPVIYDELRQQADRYLRRESPGHTLQATALVNEAYLRLVDQTHVNWQSRAHFFGAAANLMRQILIQHARTKHAEKRGGDAQKLYLDEVSGLADNLVKEQNLDLLALDDALNQLAVVAPQQSRVVELRFFAGLSIEETAEALGISPATVKREWNMAKAWLHRAISKQ
ncbi:MAG TPA: sigma-70 family RNA polymerase sigma factor [Blastocatellia bacterium]|nr:sigma-70 family RNA polymerase sigma factor [Blastocatellia bacterium]